jgi:hypothetical protein
MATFTNTNIVRFWQKVSLLWVSWLFDFPILCKLAKTKGTKPQFQFWYSLMPWYAKSAARGALLVHILGQTPAEVCKDQIGRGLEVVGIGIMSTLKSGESLIDRRQRWVRRP